jgi:hypothetical protein
VLFHRVDVYVERGEVAIDQVEIVGVVYLVEIQILRVEVDEFVLAGPFRVGINEDHICSPHKKREIQNRHIAHLVHNSELLKVIELIMSKLDLHRSQKFDHFRLIADSIALNDTQNSHVDRIGLVQKATILKPPGDENFPRLRIFHNIIKQTQGRCSFRILATSQFWNDDFEQILAQLLVVLENIDQFAKLVEVEILSFLHDSVLNPLIIENELLHFCFLVFKLIK